MTRTSPDGPAELVITRVFDAPRARVFQCWISPESIPFWWGPRGFETLTCSVDARPGGTWRVASRHEDGSETAETGVIREIEAPSRLVLTHAWESPDGRPGAETVVTITFEDAPGGTRMTFRQAGLESEASRDGHLAGWNESFDMLAEHLTRLSADSV